MQPWRSEDERLAISQLAATHSLLAVSLGRVFGNPLQHEATKPDSPAGVEPPISTFFLSYESTRLPIWTIKNDKNKLTTRFPLAFLSGLVGIHLLRMSSYSFVIPRDEWRR